MATKDGVRDLKVVTISVTGPNPYAAGGFTVDASSSLSWLGFMTIAEVGVGNLPGHEFEIALNQDATGAEAFGKGCIKIVKHQNQQASVSNTSVTGQPGGVTVQTALSANAATTHTHALDHNHGAVTSAAMVQSGNGSTAGTTPDELGHTHSFTIPNFTATSAAGGSHSHNRAFEYDHNHGTTTATTDVTSTELGGVDLSGTTFKVTCFGFGPG
jgi:hypothetical protein